METVSETMYSEGAFDAAVLASTDAEDKEEPPIVDTEVQECKLPFESGRASLAPPGSWLASPSSSVQRCNPGIRHASLQVRCDSSHAGLLPTDVEIEHSNAILRDMVGQFGPPKPPGCNSSFDGADHTPKSTLIAGAAGHDGTSSVPMPSSEVLEEFATSFVIQRSSFLSQKSRGNRAHEDMAFIKDRHCLSSKAVMSNAGADWGDILHTDGITAGILEEEQIDEHLNPEPQGGPQMGFRSGVAASHLKPQPLLPRVRSLPGNAIVEGTAPTNSICRQPSADKKSRQVEVRRALLDEKLDVATAASAVNLRDLRELRSFRNPPAVVCQVLEAVSVLLGITEATWSRRRKLLDNHFLERIRSYDPMATTMAQADRFRLLLQVPTFTDGSLGERCPAVLSLAAWCNAVHRQLTAGVANPASLPLAEVQAAKVLHRAHMGSEQADDCPRQASPVPAAPVTQGASEADFCSLELDPDLFTLTDGELAHVHEFSVSRKGIGSVTFHGLTDCRGFLVGQHLEELVVLEPGEVVVYPKQDMKPPVGLGLNKPATITLYGCVPNALVLQDRKARERYRKRVQQMTEEKGAKFMNYDCEQGIWQFQVPHF